MHPTSKPRLATFFLIATATAPTFVFAQSSSRVPAGSGTSAPAPTNGSSSRTKQSAVALQGYCPVCLVEMHQWIQGDAQFATEYDGRTYYFPGAEQLEMFAKDPPKYVPVLSGDDIVSFATSDKRVAGNIRFGMVHDGKYYFFSSQENIKRFHDAPDAYADADLALGGECIVCRVEMKQHVPGSPSITATYKGLRYLFPGEKQKSMFLKAPSRYVRAIDAPTAYGPGGSQTRPANGTSQPTGPRQPVGGSGSR
jgi:YHS domain-containing protein